MPSTPALACSDLEVTFGDTPVLRGLSFEAHAGAVTALLGPNGAGKTTAIRVLTGLVAATAGTATTLGLPAGHPDALARIGLMPQATGAWSGVRPRELLRYLASLYAHPQSVDALAERIGIDLSAKTPYRRLSGGQQQAVNLAGALVGRPDLVLLDEPCAGVNPSLVGGISTLLKDLNRNPASGKKSSFVVIEHNMDFVMDLCHRIMVMVEGRVMAIGTPAEIRANKQVLDAYLGA